MDSLWPVMLLSSTFEEGESRSIEIAERRDIEIPVGAENLARLYAVEQEKPIPEMGRVPDVSNTAIGGAAVYQRSAIWLPLKFNGFLSFVIL